MLGDFGDAEFSAGGIRSRFFRREAGLAVRAGLAVKADAYSWRQLCGAGALGGIGFTMSLFIAGVAFPDPAHYAAAKIAIFLASLIAGTLGVLVLWRRPRA